MKRKVLSFFSVILIFLTFAFIYFLKNSHAFPRKAAIVINSQKIIAPLKTKWNALAQGGEEKGVRMFANIIPQVAALYPQYIRIDHIYDFYNVVSRDKNNNLVFNWDQLDRTVCDIYHTGAKPFFVLGYMPKALSKDGHLISEPNNWQDWAYLVQKTIERYSGKNTRLCQTISGYWMRDIYYEVWNEPDLDTFGHWSLYKKGKNYKTLYYYSNLGAHQAQNVNHFSLGGPATTKAYKNWFQGLLSYIDKNKLRIDFLSWHHYTKDPDDYIDDAKKVRSWLTGPYQRFSHLPLIISEWGYDSEPNPLAYTKVGAAYTITSIRNLIDQNIKLAFLFEIKDGPQPRWGILNYQGEKTPRYQALKLVNKLSDKRLAVSGEGTFVRTIATRSRNKISVLLVNFDRRNKNFEAVPISFTNLNNKTYSLETNYLSGDKGFIKNLLPEEGVIKRKIIMPPNSIVLLKLQPDQ